MVSRRCFHAMLVLFATAVAPFGTNAVAQAPAFTSPNNVSFIAGNLSSFTITTTGTPIPVITMSGTLPGGLTFTDNGDRTATLAGTPNTLCPERHNLTFTAANGVLPNATQNFTLTVVGPPAVCGVNSLADTGDGQLAESERTAVAITQLIVVFSKSMNAGDATIVANYHLQRSGSAADIVNSVAYSNVTFASTLDINGGVALPSGDYTLTVEGDIRDTMGVPLGTDFVRHFTVGSAPSITSAAGTTFAVGAAGSFTVATSGSPAPALTEAGALPAGVTFTDNGNGTATLAGTPGAGSGGTYPLTITAANGILPNATQPFTLTVNQPPSISSANSTSFTVGSAGSFTVTTAAGYPTATTISRTGALPSGVTFVDNGNGTATLAGTPAAGSGGSYPLTITAANGILPNAGQSFTLTVNEATSITSANSATFTVGTAGSFTVTTAAAFPVAITISRSGALPTGITFVDNGNGTATLAGTPAAGTSGTYSLTITAANGILPNASQSFTLTVNGPPSITSTNSASFTVGTAGSFTVTTAAGYPTPVTISRTGSLPSGITFVDNGNGTATLAGTAAVAAGGSYPLTITASNGILPDASQSFTLTVNEAPRITSASSATFTVGTAGSFTVTTAAAFPAAIAISRSGALPAGITFVDNGNGTATLAGTPAAGSGGSYPLTIGAANGILPNASQSFTFTVNGPPSITSANNASFKVGTADSFTVTTAAGYPAATTLSRSGTLPGGVTFVDNGNGTATLAGTPAAGGGGSYPLTITASNGIVPNASQAFTLTVNEPTSITSAGSATFTVGTAGSFTVTTAAAFPAAITISRSGTLASGISFVDNGNGTATLGGTPAAGSGGSYPLTITAANGTLPNASQSFTLTINQPPSITSVSSATFSRASAGSFTVTATGFPIPAISTADAMPGGITFTDRHDGTATLAGTPAADGVFVLHFTAGNGVLPDAAQVFTLTISDAPAFTSPPAFTFVTGQAGTHLVIATGTPPPSLAMSGGILPAGVTFTDNGNGTATIAGTPAAATGGVHTLTITAANGILPNASQAFTLTVNEPPAITSAAAATFTAVRAGSFTITTGGYPAPSVTMPDPLPPGVTFVDNHNGTATIAGTPTWHGVYILHLTASNGVAPNAATTFVLTVNVPPEGIPAFDPAALVALLIALAFAGVVVLRRFTS